MQMDTVAIDTEMVQCQAANGELVLICAQVSIIDLYGNILLDTHAKPELTVVDYKTVHSGITAENLESAPALAAVRKTVLRLIRNKLLVGHAVHNDLRSLGIWHPLCFVFDIQRIPTICRMLQKPYPKLKHVTKVLLNRDIQTGSHCSLEDARATADVFLFAVQRGWVY